MQAATPMPIKASLLRDEDDDCPPSPFPVLAVEEPPALVGLREDVPPAFEGAGAGVGDPVVTACEEKQMLDLEYVDMLGFQRQSGEVNTAYSRDTSIGALLEETTADAPEQSGVENCKS